MAARSIASLSLSFGLVSIPIKLYSATESSAAIRFKLMGTGGARLRQQYVSDEVPEEAEAVDPPADAPAPRSRSASSRVVDFPTTKYEAPPPEPAAPAVIERSEMVKGYEFEKGKYVLFSPEELKALAQGSRQTIDIVSFIPEHSVDPVYFDKAYFLAPDKRGAKPYTLLLRAMQATGRCALAKWAFRSKEYVVEIRPADGGMVLQQLLYSDEVRSIADLQIELAAISDAELDLAKRLIEQISADSYDPTAFVDEEKQRILAAVEEKIAGKKIVAPDIASRPAVGAQVVDLVAALRASLQGQQKPGPTRKAPKEPLSERKPAKRAVKQVDGATPRTRATKS